MLSSWMGWDYAFKLRPPNALLSIPQMMYEYGQPRLNDVDRKSSKNSEQNLSQSYFIHHKSHMDSSKREPGSRRWEAID
jgi:hypothetical protein